MKRRRQRIAFATATESPISSLNTTPLIDVMLVLLIMFIVTIPIMSHSVKIDLPQPGETPPAEPETHRLDMDAAGALSWDGARLPEAALPATLSAFRARDPEGHVHFRVDPQARYEDFDRVLASVKRARIERLGFPDNGRFAKDIE
jgi:biopolymer transport protein ExbD